MCLCYCLKIDDIYRLFRNLVEYLSQNVTSRLFDYNYDVPYACGFPCLGNEIFLGSLKMLYIFRRVVENGVCLLHCHSTLSLHLAQGKPFHLQLLYLSIFSPYFS